MSVARSNPPEDGDAQGVCNYSGEEIEKLLAGGALERIGMGSRRACYRLPDGKHCLKCYRSDAEIAEGKYPGVPGTEMLAQSVIREIRNCRFSERRNTCCQEYRYWLSLKRRLPANLMAAFPSEMDQVLLPSRGWALVEELVVNADGSPPRKVLEAWWGADAALRTGLLAAYNALADALARYAVRFYDPPNVLAQRLADGTFRLRIMDFEPASRLFFPIDAIPAIARLKVRRRFARHLKNWGLSPEGAVA